MTDGAAKLLKTHLFSTQLEPASRRVFQDAYDRLISRDPQKAWTSGQWMTESSGGSDVGSTRTKAVRQKDGTWRLHGKKWFTSAVTSQMALTLARPEGNEAGGGNLALFYLETRDAAELLNGIRVERLKDKLGTRKVPTAELTLEGSFAELVGTTQEGTHAIEPMLVVTRAWNSISAAAFMRRGLALAQSYSRQRIAFGKHLAELALHAETLADMEAETRGALLLTLELVQLLGREESDAIDDQQRALLRLLTPIAKLTTGKQAVAVLSEVAESFGGAGYVEDTGIPMLLRDAQVLPIWEGTTNVLALDALLRSDAQAGLAALLARVNAGIETLQNDKLVLCGKAARNALEHAKQWLANTQDKASLQADARRFALTLGRSFELALLVEHAQWQLDQDAGVDVIDAAIHFSRTSIDLV